MAASSMPDRVVGPIILTSLLLFVVRMKKVVQEFRKSGRNGQQKGSGGTPHRGWEEGREGLDRL